MAAEPMQLDDIMAYLRNMANAENVKGMARYAIRADNALGIRIPVLRALGKRIKRDQPLARQLWSTGIHEARLLAIFIADARQMIESEVEQWVRDFESWDICDQCCMNVFRRLPNAREKALEWSAREGEFEKRAGFAMMATLAVHHKSAPDDYFSDFLQAILREATDERNFVKKAVNWALRQIGKRNMELNRRALKIAEQIQTLNSSAARWIARDAIRELTNPVQLERIAKK